MGRPTRDRKPDRTVAFGHVSLPGRDHDGGRHLAGGHIGRRALEPGAYRALLQASNSVGDSKTLTHAFTIVK